jgi:hypothetical protein
MLALGWLARAASAGFSGPFAGSRALGGPPPWGAPLRLFLSPPTLLGAPHFMIARAFLCPALPMPINIVRRAALYDRTRFPLLS